MNTGGDLLQSRFGQALRTQAKAEHPHSNAFPCPYGSHSERIFKDINQLFDHVKDEHSAEIAGMEQRQARALVKDAAIKLRRSDLSDATTGNQSAPDLASLSLDPRKELRQRSPPSGRKRRADDDFIARQGKAPTSIKVVDDDYSRQIPYTIASDRTKPKAQESRLFDHKLSTKGTASPYHSTPEPPSEWSVEAAKSGIQQSGQQSPDRPTAHHRSPKSQNAPRQPLLIELLRFDSRYPGLLMQPDSRPISQEQLASEVKSIYAGLTMVENKCIHVDRAQAAAAQDNSDSKLAPDHWQALIALHRTLLHEHHDFFLASQHPSASPALRRLAAKYSMPARMWKHGIHSFLELLRRRLPDSIDYMLAFIYLAYQMMALLYETVPAFEDTWIECLGDLGRYRMAIEDEDIKDRETWAGVARSWYTKAADKNPTVGRLYHHLAILARPHALQQLYYYSRSLTCVKPFPSARESILTLLDPILGRAKAPYSHALPIDTSFIKAHALLFENKSLDELEQTTQEFLGSLDNHIGRVTAKWKEQGVYIAVTNISAWHDYGIEENALRQVFLTQIFQKSKSLPPVPPEDVRTASPADQQDPVPPSIPEAELQEKINTLSTQPNFVNAKLVTTETFALILHRIGDKNVLPYVHVMLAFYLMLASSQYVSQLLEGTPWTQLVAFLNTLIKSETQLASQAHLQDSQSHSSNINTLLSADMFSSDISRGDEMPLPEDYRIRGLVWTQGYYPKDWFDREHDEEERYLELASTVKGRMERVLRLGYKLSTHNRWISYDQDSHTFQVVAPSQLDTAQAA